MNIKNVLLNGKIRNIETKDGKIVSVNEDKNFSGFDAEGRKIIPGLIDVHAHGCVGLDALDADFQPMCEFLASKGTTSWLPTTMTTDIDTLIRVTHSKIDFPGTQILGFHLEGPYISPKYKGAQNENFIKAPDYEEYKKLKNVKMITIAPEQPGSMEFIEKVTKEGVIISLGHTDTDYDTAINAINAGANSLTHTFNAMPPLHHRKPGPIGAGSEKHIYAQIITDGVHIHKASVLCALKMFGSDRLTIISDSIRPAGFPVGTESESGGLPVIVKNGAVYLKESENTLAGSGSTLWQCVKSAVKMGIDFDEAVKMATLTPATMLGIKKGKIEEGYDADFLLLDENNEISNIFIKGERFN